MSFLDAKTFLLELLEHSVDGVLAVDTQGLVVVWNPALERMFGKPKASVIGQPLLEVLAFLSETGEDWSIRESMWGQPCTTEQQPFFLPETGREGWYEAQYTPLRDGNGEIVGVLGILRDVTEARRKLETSHSEAQHREEALKRQLRRKEVNPSPAAPFASAPPRPKAVPPAPVPPPVVPPAPVVPPEPAVLPRSLLPPALQPHPPSPPDPPVEPVPTELGSEAPIFDRDAALDCVGNPEVLEDLMQGFIVSLPEFVREMDHAVGRRDFTVVFDHAADVKQAVVTLGGVRATRIATRLEAAAGEGKAEEVERTWWRLRRELAMFRETLRNSRKAA